VCVCVCVCTRVRVLFMKTTADSGIFESDAVCHLWMTSGVKGLMKVNN